MKIICNNARLLDIIHGIEKGLDFTLWEEPPLRCSLDFLV